MTCMTNNVRPDHFARFEHKLSVSLLTKLSVVRAGCCAQAMCTQHTMLSGGDVTAVTNICMFSGCEWTC